MSDMQARKHIGDEHIGAGKESRRPIGTTGAATHTDGRGPFADISLQGVSYRYPECSDLALNDVTVRFERGRIAAVVGPNGSGKTTLVKVVSLLLRPSSGRVTSGGDDIEWTLANRMRLSVVFQDSERFALSFRQNVELGRESYAGRIDELIKHVGLHDVVASTPDGADTLIGREFGGNDLSGGELQRLLIARGTFTSTVGALILDEASSGLDPVAEYELIQSVRAACQDKIGIVVSHRLSSIIHADVVYFMHDGKIVESGTPHDLLNSNGPFAQMFNVQARATGYLAAVADGTR